MSEIGAHAAVGIENVEWLTEGTAGFTVRVTGRWRRRRGWVGSEARGPTTLMIESGGQRHRFPAMPEPPSLAGVAPGTWRLSFAVPAELTPGPDGRAWLSLGSVTVPLPLPASRSQAAAPEPPEIRAAPEPPPTPQTPEPSAPAAREAADASLEAERAWRRAEAAEREASQLGARVQRLEHELADERRARAQASESIADGERRRRAAEQRAHAEEAMRRDLSEQLAAQAAEAARARRAMGDLARAEERIRELETRLDAVRRAGDEAQRTAAAARAARERAERELAGRAGSGAFPHPSLRAPEPSLERDRLALEDALRMQRHKADMRVPAEPPLGRVGTGPYQAPVAVSHEELVALPHTATVAALRRELAARTAAEAGLRARIVAAETRLAARVIIEQRTASTLRELGTELTTLRVALERERARREAAEAERDTMRAQLGGQRARSKDAYAAIDELRGALDRLAPGGGSARTATPAAGEPAPATGKPASATGEPAPARGEPAPAAMPATGQPPPAVTPERLSDALARLRESTEPRAEPAEAPPPSAPPPTASPPLPVPRAATSPAASPRSTLEPAVRRLARHDAAQAGRVIVSLVGAQRAAYPRPLSYDLVLGPGHGCLQVTVGAEDITVQLAGAARGREQVDLQLIGDPARIVRRLLAGPLRRLAPIGLARVRGRRDGLAALRALLGLPLDLRALRAAGMRADPEALLALVVAMIDPAWTRGERFTVAHTDEGGITWHLQIRDGRVPLVTRAASDTRVATTLSGSGDGLLEALTGEPPADATASEPDAGAPAGVTLGGDRGPLALLRTWVDRAQCG